MSRYETAVICKTLNCFLQGLVGKTTTIDLRNESSVTGLIELVDGYMNMYVKDVVWKLPNGQVINLVELFVRGRQIRFVHIPEDVNVMQTIEQQLEMMRRKQSYTDRIPKPSRGKPSTSSSKMDKSQGVCLQGTPEVTNELSC